MANTTPTTPKTVKRTPVRKLPKQMPEGAHPLADQMGKYDSDIMDEIRDEIRAYREQIAAAAEAANCAE